MVHINYHTEIFGECPTPSGVPLTYLLSQLDLSAVAQEIEKHYYSPSVRKRFHYRVELMLKLWVYKRYRHLTFRTVIDSLTLNDLFYLLTNEELKKFNEGRFKLPSPSALHHFLTYRLGEYGMKFIMSLLGSELLHLLNIRPENAQGLVGIIDSTPLIASRYSPYAVYNLIMRHGWQKPTSFLRTDIRCTCSFPKVTKMMENMAIPS